MTFSLSGDTITQVGTDTNFDNLELLNGVTLLEVGSGDRHYRIYKLDGRKLLVNGNLTIDERTELVFDENAPVRALTISSTGTLILGNEQTINQATRYPDWCPLTFTRPYPTSGGSLDNDNDIHVEGAITAYGGTIKTSGTIVFESGSTVRLITGKIIGEAGTSTRIRQRSTTLSLEVDYTIQGSLRFDFFQPPVNAAGFRVAFTDRGGFQALSSAINGGSDGIFSYPNFDAEGITYAGDAFRGARVQFTNLELAGELLVTHNQRTASDTYYPITTVEKDFTLNVRDSQGNNISGARYFLRDTNNGNRPTQSASWNDGNSEDFAPDRTYTDVSVNGDIGRQRVLTRTIREGQSFGGTYNNTRSDWLGAGESIIDYRGKSNSFTDLFDISVWSYGHQYGVLRDTPLRGRDISPLSIILLSDPSITNTDMAAVSAYTGIAINHTTRTITISENHNLDELYDFIKANKILEANIEQPTISTLLASASGMTLDISNYNLVLNTGVNLNSGTKFSALRTTGTATLNGSANIGITDATGQLVTISLNVPNAQLYIEVISSGTSTFPGRVSLGTSRVHRLVVPINATIRLTAKAEGYAHTKIDLDTSTSLIFSITLVRESNVDLGEPITITDTAVEFEFNENRFSRLLFDAVNLTGRLEESKRIFDRQMTTPQAVEFLHKYDTRARASLLPETGLVFGIKYLDGNYYVASRNPHKIYVYDENFVYSHQFDLNAATDIPIDISDGPEENKLYILNGDDVHRYHVDGTYEGVQFTGLDASNTVARGLAWRNNRFYVGDQQQRKLFAYANDGTRESTDDIDGTTGLPKYLDYDDRYYMASTITTDSIIIHSGSAEVQNYPTGLNLRGITRGSRVIPGSATNARESFVVTIRENETFEIYSFDTTNQISGANTAILADYEDILDGRPYEIQQDGIVINGDFISFEKKTTIPILGISQFGITVYNRNEEVLYRPPIRDNGDVRIDNPSQVTILKSSTSEIVVDSVTQNREYLDAISNANAQAVSEELSDDLEEIVRDVSELDGKLGNTETPEFVASNGVNEPEFGTSTGVREAGFEHGVLSSNNASAVYALYQVEENYEADEAAIHIDLNDIRREEGGSALDYIVEIYALQDVDSLDFIEGGTTKFEAFRTANQSRRVYSRIETSFVDGRFTLPVGVAFNRVALVFRNNNLATNTTELDFKELKVSIIDVLKRLTDEISNDVNDKLDAIKAKTDEITFTGDDLNANVRSITETHSTGQVSRSLRVGGINGVFREEDMIDGDATTFGELTHDGTSQQAILVVFAALHTEEQITAEQQSVITINIGGVTLTDGNSAGTNQFDLRVYALQDVDNAHFSTTSARDQFFADNADRLIAHRQTGEPGAITITARPNFAYNRIVIIFRNLSHSITLRARINEVTLNVENLLQALVTDITRTKDDTTTLTERIRSTLNSMLEDIATSSSSASTAATELASRLTATRAGKLDGLPDDTATELAEITSKLVTTLDMSAIFANGSSNIQNARNALGTGETELGGHSSLTDYHIYSIPEARDGVDVSFNVLTSLQTLGGNPATTTLNIYAVTDVDSIASNNYDFINANSANRVYQEEFTGVTSQADRMQTIRITRSFNRLVFVITQTDVQRREMTISNLRARFDVPADNNDRIRTLLTRLSDPRAVLLDSIDTIRKHITNRKRVDPTANTKTIYDDDKTTALTTFDLKDTAGNASTDDATEENPRG